jgi:hypothetical protein
MYHCYLRGHVDMHNSSVKEGPRKKERQRKKKRKKASVICMRALTKKEGRSIDALKKRIWRDA